jgi:hypothetical protein
MSKPTTTSKILTLSITAIPLLILSGCSSSKPKAIDYDMTCEQISQEIETTRAALYTERANGGGNGSQVASTAADVAATGAGMAGVPYVGGIYSIGKTLLNHRKYSNISKADSLMLYMDELEYLSQRKLCNR